MEVVTNLEERFLPRAEGMVLDFVSLSEPSVIITSDNKSRDFILLMEKMKEILGDDINCSKFE